MNQIITKCKEIVEKPKEFLRAQKEEKGLNYIGYTCPFLPEELVYAAGFIPIRIFGFEDKLIYSEKYIPSNCCEFSKNIIEFLLTPEAQILDGLIFTHCCDTLQVVADITPTFFKNKVFKFNIPTDFKSDFALAFTNRELDKLKAFLEEQKQSPITSDDMKKSWEVYYENRTLVKKLYQLRHEKPGIISGSDCMALIVAGLYLPKTLHNQYLGDVVNTLEHAETVKTNVKNVIVSGFNNGNPGLLRLIEESGCNIVFEDMCETSRSIPHKLDKNFSYPDSLSTSLVSKYCPVKNYKDMDYSDIIIKKIEETGAKGIIFILFPFCDPQYIEYAALKRKLNEKRIKSIVLEPVIRNTNSAQLQTRIEAFMESI